eukprot:g12523.t1
MSCFKRKQRSADNIQVHPAGSSARKPRLEAPSLQDGSSSGGTPTDSDNKTDLPNPTDEELAKAVASVEEERRLVVETRALLCLEQERRRNVSEQLAAAHLSLGKARESYEHAQERLAEEQKQRRKVDEKLRTLNVLRKSDRQEKNELEADRDRYKSIVQDMMSKRLLAGGTNIQAAFPTLLELQKDIRRALTMSVSEWIEDSTSVLNLGITPQHLLPQLFHACQNVVESYHGDIKAFFMGGPGADREGCDKADDIMDESTASDMRQHMRRHYRRLFPIEGIPFQKAFCGITSRLAGVDAGTEDRARRLAVSGLENIVQVYLPIMVGVLLQHPTVRFAGNCGMETAFCPKIHADSLDGDDVAAGDKCIIVFPALMREVEEAEGHQPLTHAYILPLPGA